jgi:hypothetical protein
MIEVKLIKAGEQLVEYSLQDGSTIENLFDIAGRVFEGAQVNGLAVDKNYVLHDKNRVFVGSKVVGNSDVEIKFMKIGSVAVSYTSQSGVTLEDFFNKLEPKEKSKYIDENNNNRFQYSTVTGVAIDKSYVFEDTNTPIRIVLGEKVKGND